MGLVNRGAARRSAGASRVRRWAAIGACLALACSTACETAPPAPAKPPAKPAEAVRDSEPALGSPIQITFAGRRSGEGYFDASGRYVVFQSEREPGNPFYQIYRMDLLRGGLQRLSPGVGKTSCGWLHPGGRLALFSSTHADPGARDAQRAELSRRAQGKSRRYEWDFDSAYEIYLVPLDSEGRPGTPRALAPAPGYDAEASMSPDGRHIVFASNRHAYDPLYASAFSAAEREQLERDPSVFVDLYRMDLRGGGVTRIVSGPGYDGGPFFSPDGEHIVWRRFSEDGRKAEVWTARADGSEARAITSLGALSWAPFFHPSGDYILFSSNQAGGHDFELYAVATAGTGEPVRITTHPGFDGLPSFSPDGETLLWTAQRGTDRRSQLFRADWDDAWVRDRLGLPTTHQASAPSLLPLPARTRPEIDEADLRAHVEALTADVTAGRRAGTSGERIATGYVARALRAYGLEPAGDHGTFFHEFGFTAGVSLGPDNRLAWSDPRATDAPFQLDVDWRPLGFSRSGEVEPAPVVFAGYGLVAPAGGGLEAMDDYAELDVAGRWVMVFRFVPRDLPGEGKRHLRRFSSLRHKAMIARDRGAAGLLVVSGPTSQVRRPLPTLRLDGALADSGLPVIALSDAAAGRLLPSDGPDLLALQREWDRGAARRGRALGERRLAATIDLEQERRQGRSVLGALRVPRDDPDAPVPPAVVIGAHVDHLGQGGGPLSLDPDAAADAIHYGADDNASGVAALLEIAQDLAERRDQGRFTPRRDVLFAAWSGEELGLLGSSRWVEDQGSPHQALGERVAAYLNLDMVGRLDDSLVVYGSGTSPVWDGLVERFNLPIALPITLQESGYLPTDSTPFVLGKVPVLSAFTGIHDDYHKPSDTADKLALDETARIAELVRGIAGALAEASRAPEFVATDISMPGQGQGRAVMRVALGTVPDYARTDVQGVRLSGVSPGGPAEQAGLRAGDVIVGVAEREVRNIYDYTYALEVLEVGEEVGIRIRRDGEELELRVVPASRQ